MTAGLPDFLVIGAPKAGTTALHVALARHPQLYLSRVKEPKHFLSAGPPPLQHGPGDVKTRNQQVWQRDKYEALFAGASAGALRGESTSLYLHDPDAMRRIRETIPDVRLIALLRDPVDRAHSNWTHLWSAGLEPEADFVRACSLEDKRRRAGWAPFWRYLSLGRYGEQLEHVWSLFPREQTLVLRYRELRESPAETLDRITGFLGVDTGVLTSTTPENVTTHASGSLVNQVLGRALRLTTAVDERLPRPFGLGWHQARQLLERHLQREQRPRAPLTAEQREALTGHFTDDVRRLERLTGESFGDWLDTGREVKRAALAPPGRIGTAHQSIDRPIKG